MFENDDKIGRINALIKDRLMRMMPEQGMRKTVNMGGMAVYRHETVNKMEHCFYEPLIVVILQGRKHSVVGSEKVTYGANQCMITGVDLPISSYLTDVSREKPLLSITLPVDKYLISNLSPDTPSLNPDDVSMKAMATADMDEHLMDAFLRLTTLSPLQYQKKLRLYEARRLMLTGSHNAAGACYAVGYESPTQFNREYKRMFGEPPRASVRKLRVI